MEIRSNICFLSKHNTEKNEFKMHSHDCYELVYFLTGKGRAVIDQKSYPVSEHMYCIIPPQTEHVECMEDYGEIQFIGFECRGDGLPLSGGVYDNVEASSFALLERIFDEYRTQNLGYAAAAQALLQLVLLALARSRTVNAEKSKDLNYIKAYIEQYSEQKINFRELAALCGYSSDYFRHRFRQRFGVSPQEYMIHIRLEKARRMLETTNLSCTEVAYHCGFSNSAQMSVMFKRKYGMTPSRIK